MVIQIPNVDFRLADSALSCSVITLLEIVSRKLRERYLLPTLNVQAYVRQALEYFGYCSRETAASHVIHAAKWTHIRVVK